MVYFEMPVFNSLNEWVCWICWFIPCIQSFKFNRRQHWIRNWSMLIGEKDQSNKLDIIW